ncbi:ABC transporter ATP-binding protein [Rathayibacter sp. CAU 1779]
MVSGSGRTGVTTDADEPTARTRGTATGARRQGRVRVTGAAANRSVVAEADAAEPGSLVAATGVRGSGSTTRVRASKGTGVVSGAVGDDVRSGAASGADAVASASASAPTGWAKTSARLAAPTQAAAASGAVVEPAAAPAGTGTKESTRGRMDTDLSTTQPGNGETTGTTEVDTDPLPEPASRVDENTGSRQRITLFGRRRKAALAASAVAIETPADDDQGSDLLAELVRETEAATPVATPELTPPPLGGGDDVPEWVIEQIYESDERDAALAGADAMLLEETADRSTLTRETDDRRGAVDQPDATPAQPRARRAAETRAFPPARPAPTSAAPVVLAVNGLHKRYGDVVAVDGVHLTVRAGSLYGIVGPNGAGKTTTLSIVTGLLRPDSGAVIVNGVDARKRPRDAKRAIGVLPDHLRTFDRLTGAQLLYYAGTLRGLDASTTRRRSADLAAAFGIEDAMGRLVADYSAGMTKKVSLAAAMIHSPRLLVLDEPFEGVDPVSSATVTGILQRYVDAGGTVLLSSHSMDLVQRVCDSVAIIVGGVVLDAGPVDQVRGDKSLEDHFIELAGGRKAVEGLEWLHSFSD